MKNLCWEFGLDRWAEKCPDKIAVLDNENSLTYAQLQQLSFKLAGSLREMGIGKNDYIFLSLINRVEFAVVFFAAMRLHIPLSAVNPQFRKEELTTAINYMHPRIGFVGTEETAQMVRQADPNIRLFQATFDNPEFQKLLNRPVPDIEDYPCDPEEICSVVYTSGSSGTPKYVARSYQAQLQLSKDKIERMHANEQDVTLISLPLCQNFGQGVLQMSCIMGATAILTPKFRAKESLELIERYKVTLRFGVPTMFIREIQAYDEMENKPDISSLRTGIVSGSVSDSSFLQWFDRYAGCRLLNTYGLTELGSLTMPDYDDSPEIRFNTTGHALPGIRLRLLADSEETDTTPIIGEILCKSDYVMQEYIGHPKLTSDCFTEEGWFKTGDLGQLDAHGFLQIVGRKKEIIIRAGFNVVPAEVEQVYLTHPDIVEVCIMGYPDPILGERILAFVQLSSEANLSKTELRSYGASHLAKYKLPDSFIQVQKMPHLETEKYNKKVLYSIAKHIDISSFLKDNSFKILDE